MRESEKRVKSERGHQQIVLLGALATEMEV